MKVFDGCNHLAVFGDNILATALRCGISALQFRVSPVDELPRKKNSGRKHAKLPKRKFRGEENAVGSTVSMQYLLPEGHGGESIRTCSRNLDSFGGEPRQYQLHDFAIRILSFEAYFPEGDWAVSAHFVYGFAVEFLTHLCRACNP